MNKTMQKLILLYCFLSLEKSFSYVLSKEFLSLTYMHLTTNSSPLLKKSDPQYKEKKIS